MSTSDVAAWWGAILATAVFAWDIYKWKLTGPRLRVKVLPGMSAFGSVPNVKKDAKYVLVEVVNLGDKRTEITHLVGLYYSSWFGRLKGKNTKSIVVVNPAFATRFPCVIEPGERWTGGIEQTAELKELSRTGLLFCGIIHSAGKRPLTERVVIKD